MYVPVKARLALAVLISASLPSQAARVDLGDDELVAVASEGAENHPAAVIAARRNRQKRECRDNMDVVKTRCSKPCGRGKQTFTVPSDMLYKCRNVQTFEKSVWCNDHTCFEDVQKYQKAIPAIVEPGRLTSFTAVLAPELNADVLEHPCELSIGRHRMILSRNHNGTVAQATPKSLERAFVYPTSFIGWKGCEFKPEAFAAQQEYEERRQSRRSLEGLKFQYYYTVEVAPPTATLKIAVLRPNAVRILMSIQEHGASTVDVQATLTTRSGKNIASTSLSVTASQFEFSKLQPQENYKLHLELSSAAGGRTELVEFKTSEAGCGSFYKCCRGVDDPFIHMCVFKNLWGGRCTRQEPLMTAAEDPESCSYE